MIVKTIHITLGILVALAVWCAALMLAVLIAMTAWHVLVMGGFTVYHLMHS
jgi:hypothetical protein